MKWVILSLLFIGCYESQAILIDTEQVITPITIDTVTSGDSESVTDSETEIECVTPLNKCDDELQNLKVYVDSWFEDGVCNHEYEWRYCDLGCSDHTGTSWEKYGDMCRVILE